MKKILFGLIALGALTACEEDYSKYAAPQAYGPESAVNIQMEITPTNYNIDMNTDENKDVALFNYTTPNTEIESITANVILFGDTIPGYGKDGKIYVAANDVDRLVGILFRVHNATPRPSNVKADVVAHTADGDGAFFEQTSTVQVTQASIPEYAGGYTLTVNNADAGAFTKVSDGVYTIVVTTEKANSSILFNAVNGDTKSPVGTYVEDSNDADGPLAANANAKTINIEKAGDWLITLDLNNGVYKVEKNLDELWYAGDANGWGFSPLADRGNGWFEGYYYINKPDYSSTWGFKFPTANNWDEPQYGWSDAGKDRIALGGGNLDLPDGYDSGFYRIKASKKEGRYELMLISVISIIGSATGDPNWGTDIDMTYDTSDRCWKVTADFVQGEFKFRANHDWSLSWGGAETGMTMDGGWNLGFPETGTYTVKFHPECNGHGWWSIER